MLPSLAAASPTPAGASAGAPRWRSRKESQGRSRAARRKGARSLELGRWEARNGVEMPPRGSSADISTSVNFSANGIDRPSDDHYHVPHGGHAAIAHFNETMGGGQALMNVTLNLPETGQLCKNGYILSGLTRSENEDATAKLMLLRDLGVEASQVTAIGPDGEAVIMLSPKQHSPMRNLDPSKFEELLLALKTGVPPEETAAAAAKAEEEAKKEVAKEAADEEAVKAGLKEGSAESFDDRLAKRRPRPVRLRVEEQLLGYREHAMMYEGLEKRVVQYREAEREKVAIKKAEEEKRNARKRPQGPMAGEIHQAIQAAKADMVRERRERAEKQKDIRAMSLRDRRKAKKSEDAAARRAERHKERDQGLMSITALGSRLEFMRQLMENYRDRVANDTQKKERDAVQTIEAYYLAYRFKQMMRREREKYTAAVRVLQRNYRVHYGQLRLLKKMAAATRIKEFIAASKRTGKIQIALRQFRMACVLIQRYWKSKAFKKTSELALLCKYWDSKKDRASAYAAVEVAKAKELAEKAKEKGSKKKGPDYKKLAAKQREKVDALPKFQLKAPVPIGIKRQVLAKWLSNEKANHCSKMNVYFSQKRRYDAEYERLRSILETRRMMGAALPKELGREPRMPRMRLMPLFAANYVGVIREGEREVERHMRKELARKRKEKEEAQQKADRAAQGLTPEGEEEAEDGEYADEEYDE